MLFEKLSISLLAKRILARTNGGIILIGGSPIKTGLAMVRHDPERDYQFVPFSGSWMRNYDNTYKGRRYYDRSGYLRDDKKQGYLKFLQQTHGIFVEKIADNPEPTNLVDYCTRGGSLVSFADLLVSTARTSAMAKVIAANLNLVAITGKNPLWHNTAKSAWTCGHLGLVESPTASYSIRHGVWYKQMLGAGGNFESDAPRLTAPYPAIDWNMPPVPAPASNIAAFWKAAKGIDLEKLKNLEI